MNLEGKRILLNCRVVDIEVGLFPCETVLVQVVEHHDLIVCNICHRRRDIYTRGVHHILLNRKGICRPHGQRFPALDTFRDIHQLVIAGRDCDQRLKILIVNDPVFRGISGIVIFHHIVRDTGVNVKRNCKTVASIEISAVIN